MVETYGEILDKRRDKNKKEFYDKNPLCKDLFDIMDSFLSLLVLKIKDIQIDISDSAKTYKIKLIVSFIRTHYVINNLICNGENIEAVTLIRKQLELLARYKEIETNSVDSLIGKTPNIKFVENSGRLYSVLSEIAHSSKEDTLSLLGIQEVEDKKIGFHMFPIYTEDLITTVSNHINIFCRFSSEMLVFLKDIIPDWNGEEEMKILDTLVGVGKESDIPFFESWDE